LQSGERPICRCDQLARDRGSWNMGGILNGQAISVIRPRRSLSIDGLSRDRTTCRRRPRYGQDPEFRNDMAVFFLLSETVVRRRLQEPTRAYRCRLDIHQVINYAYILPSSSLVLIASHSVLLQFLRQYRRRYHGHMQAAQCL